MQVAYRTNVYLKNKVSFDKVLSVRKTNIENTKNTAKYFNIGVKVFFKYREIEEKVGKR